MQSSNTPPQLTESFSSNTNFVAATSLLVSMNILDFKNSPDFYRIMLYMQREQSARIIQRAWRANHPSAANAHKYIETLNGPLSLRFIKKPIGIKYLDHARNIQQGNWLALDFADPEFVRNIYAACAYKVISPDQLVTTLLLNSAKKMFGAEIKKHKLSESTPYDYHTIDYLTPEKTARFKKSLTDVKETDRYYFSVNLSHRMAISYLLYALQREYFGNKLEKLKAFVINYIRSRNFDSKIKEKMIQDIQQNFKDKSPVMQKISQFILYHESTARDVMREKSLDLLTVHTIIEGARLAEAIPEFEMSPDFDPTNPETPLFSFVFLSMPVFNKLQIALHGKDATLPFYVAGRFSPQLVRQADEGANWFKARQRRPVELIHPDLIPDDYPHGAQTTEFGMLFHDLFHVCRNGVNQYKDLIRAVRQFMEVEKSYNMSKGLWFVTDMDFADCKKIRMLPDSQEKTDLIHNFFTTVFYYACNNSSHVDVQHCLFLAGIIKNSAEWCQLMNISLDNWLAPKNGPYKNIFNTIRKIIQSDSVEQQKQRSASYYVLRMALMAVPDGVKICNALDKTDIMAWQRNGGMYVKACYTSTGKDETIEQDSLVNHLRAALINYQRLNRIEIVVVDEAKKKLLNDLQIEVRADFAKNRYVLSRQWLKQTFRTAPQKYKQLQRGLGQEYAAALDWRMTARR